MCAEMRATKELSNSALALLTRDHAAQRTKLQEALQAAGELARRQQQEASAFIKDTRERLASSQDANAQAIDAVRAASQEACDTLVQSSREARHGY